ncbi:MAG: peptidoglycan DD-metalloendopeptidase family protein, partial [Armatimonadetes bacterium]|nr:peptidoglycan DD-metalloendopeptidase family protein [Armatimonadota bacterium]
MIPISMKKRALWMVIAVLCLGFAARDARAGLLDDIGNSISSLWRQKAQKQQSAQKARSTASAQSQQVEFLHNRLQRTQNLLEEANSNYHNYWRQMRRTEAKIAETRERIERVTARYKAHRVQFSRRLAAIQRRGETNYLQVALGSASLSDLTRRAAFFQAITQRDSQLQEELKADKAELVQARNALMAQWNERRAMMKAVGRERARIAEGEREQTEMWKRLNASRLALINYAFAQEQSSQHIGGMIGSLQERKARVLAQYQAQAAREQAALRRQAEFRAREREKIARYERYQEEQRRIAAREAAERRSYSRSSQRRSYDRDSRRYGRRDSYRRYSNNRYSNRRNSYNRYSRQRPDSDAPRPLAPRIELTPRLAPRVEIAPMDIDSLRRSSGWQLPARGRVSSHFGVRFHPVSGRRKLHTGHDIAAAHGAPIRAARAGRVVWAGWKQAYGHTVIVDNGNGVSTLYGHASRVGVRAGQPVRAGR